MTEQSANNEPVGGLGAQRFKLLFLSQLAEPDKHDLSVYRGLPEGEEDGAWYASRLRELGIMELVELTVVQVCLGDPLPEPEKFQAAVIGGSYHMVSENRPWQRALLEWLAAARAACLPCLGICGGHQLMAHRFGAMVGPVPEGVWCGTLSVNLTPEGAGHWLFDAVADDTGYHVANYEHVTSVPSAVTVLATHRDSPAVALDYGQNWVSVQFHPEMSAQAMAASWARERPQWAKHYRHSAQAPRLLVNFLIRAGLSVIDDF